MNVAILLPFGIILAFALGVGVKCVCVYHATRSSLNPADLNERRAAQHNRGLTLLSRPSGRSRESGIAGIVKNLIRHKDGAYTKAYHIDLQPSIFDHEERLEQRVDELARLLSARKPTNTVIQFRLSVAPDRGVAIHKHLVSK